MPEPLPEGLYESLRTSGLEQSLSHLRDLEPRFAPVDPADAPEVLARHVARSVRRLLADERDEEKRAAIVNELMDVIHAPDERLVDGLEQLVVLTRAIAPGVYELQRPATPLSSAALLTNGPDEPTLGSELRAELSSADRVDLLCAFIRWHGLRVLEEPLLRLRERGVPLRVITTTYVGATERRAIDELVHRFGADVRITYETQSTRLHAKAWLLRRNSGFDTAYVGSSNLSSSALVDGLEWNVRLSGVATPELLRKFSATFDTYWADPAFVRYDPATDADRLDDALARSGSRGASSADITLSGLEVRPLPHQTEILEALESEREIHHRHRNLVIAATGTGKTVVAALDYRRLSEQQDGQARCCSSLTGRRSCSSPFGCTGRCSRTAPSASCTSRAADPSGGTTSSPASSRSPRTASTGSRRTTSTSWSSTSSTMRKHPPTAACSTTFSRRSSLA